MNSHGALQLPEKNLKVIRAALVLPQDRAAFESGLAEVRATQDAAELDEFVDVWWLIACDSVRDPKGRADMYDRAGHLHNLATAGVPFPKGGRTWRELFAEHGIASPMGDHTNA